MKNMSNRMPVTRSLLMIDRLLSLLILAMGLIIAYLSLTTGNVMLALAAMIFLTIGLVKNKDIIMKVFHTARKSGPATPAVYRQILLPVSRPEAAESLVNMAYDVL